MKVNAYLLAADPAWIEASVLSYYDCVERIVVSYDADSRGWTGVPIDVDSCLRRLRAIDRDGKLDFRPGTFAAAASHGRPMVSETAQRQAAIEHASLDADWVMQLDTDEVIGDRERFMACLDNANQAGAEGLDYPSRWLYKRVGKRTYLEQCRRGWRTAASYPGPMAIRAHTRLKFARQGPERRYRVDFAPRNTDPSYPRDANVDEVVSLKQGISHFSWTRSDTLMEAKATNSSHACDFDWGPLLTKWRAAGRHPLLAALMSQRERGNRKRHLRLARVSLPSHIFEQLPTSFDLTTGEISSNATGVFPLSSAVSQTTSSNAVIGQRTVTV